MDVEIIFIAFKILDFLVLEQEAIELILTYFNYLTETETTCESKLDVSIL